MPVVVCGLAVMVSGCRNLTSDLPAGTPNPSYYNTASGAVGLRNAAVIAFQSGMDYYLVESGLLTDELQSPLTGASAGVQQQNGGAVSNPLDERILPEGLTGIQSWSGLHTIRGKANLALNALAAYDTIPADSASQRQLRSELFSMQGYAELLLADFFCSGVPLTTLDFQGDFTYRPGSSTTQVYQDALQQLDSALVLAGADDSLRNLALVLRGRTYLQLGQYAAAADDVVTVPTGFRYTLPLPLMVSSSFKFSILATVSDQEGVNGLPYRSGGDARTAVQVVCTPGHSTAALGQCPSDTLTFPKKYSAALSGKGYAPFTMASGIEARLIQAEAEYHGVATGMQDWLAELNALRQSAISPALPVLADPGTPSAQVALLFKERAYWLFVSGHRQGDLRRLLRQYGSQPQYSAFQSQQNVYPIGTYTAPGTGRYGSDITAPIPSSEYANPYFHGCFDRNA